MGCGESCVVIPLVQEVSTLYHSDSHHPPKKGRLISSRVGKTRPGIIALVVLVLAVAVVVTGCAGAPVRGWSGPSVASDFLYVGSITGKLIALENVSGTSFRVAWEKPFETSASGGLFSCGQISTPMSTYGVPAIQGDKVYVGAYDGNIYSIRTDDLSMNRVDTGSAIVGSPVVTDDYVIFGNSDGKLFGFNLQLGEEWTFETGDKIWASPEVDGDVVYIGSADHKIYALDLDSGTAIWQFEAQGAVLSTPLVADGTVYIGASDNRFYAIDAATEEERLDAIAREEGTPVPSRSATWVFAGANNWFWTRALLHEGEIWAGCLDQKLYVLDAETGEKVWEFETAGMIRTPPVEVGGVIVIGSQDGNVYAIDPEARSTRVLASLEAPVLAPIAVDSQSGLVYVHAQDGSHTLYALEVATGREVWSFETS